MLTLQVTSASETDGELVVPPRDHEPCWSVLKENYMKTPSAISDWQEPGDREQDSSEHEQLSECDDR